MLSNSLAGRSLLVIMLITLSCMVYFDQILHTYTFKHCLDTGMQNGDKALPCIRSTGRGQSLKMIITLEPHGIFDHNLVYLYILT